MALLTLWCTKAYSTRLCVPFQHWAAVELSYLSPGDLFAFHTNHVSSSNSLSSFEVAKVMDSLNFSDPRRVPALPLRPSRLAEEAMNRGAVLFDSAHTLTDTWNAWTDCIEKVFQQMGDQLEDLEVSDDGYITFIRLFASHPARPTVQPLREIMDHEGNLVRTIPHRYLADVQDVSMTAELGRCNVLASPFEMTSTRRQLHGILRSMLGPGRLFQGVVDTRAHEAMATGETNRQGASVVHVDEMISGIEHMNLCDPPPTIHVESGEGLVVLLKKMSIEEGTPGIS